MRRFILTILLCGTALQGFCQSAEDARILERDEVFTMQSKTDGIYKVHVKVRVENENGEDAALFHLFTDSFMSLSDFKGELETGIDAPRDLVFLGVPDNLGLRAGEVKMPVADLYLQRFQPADKLPGLLLFLLSTV